MRASRRTEVGDRGAWPGNDYEILRAPLGLSVDECSLDPDSCWPLTKCR
jgi:hypothetical protein